MLASLVEMVYNGNEKYPAQSDAIFVWLSDSPELNKQSRDKFYFNADRINSDKLIMIDESNFSQEFLDDGKIYFLNTQKLSKTSRLTRQAENRQYTIWETLENTIKDKASKLYCIIDEAHRGMKGKDAGRATTIMQKFIKGSEEDNLSPMPVIIGMTATPERFEKLLAKISISSHPVEVTEKEVQESGLLKERIIVVYPDEEKNKAASREMAVLEAAADDWKSKCEHWQKYLSEQGEKIFTPILVIQVENIAAHSSKLSATDLDDCLKKISERTGITFEVGEVVHTFGQSQANIQINNLRVPYAEPSSISGNDKIRVVFFKENLSTGWDCPHAETMMSFRHAVDATYIAQLLGRMIRTPLHRRIDLDDTLNEVRLFLPNFDKATVQSIIDAYKQSEGNTIPAEVIGESLASIKNSTLTVNDVPPIYIPKTPAKISTSTSTEKFSYSAENKNVAENVADTEKKSTINHFDERDIFETIPAEPAQIDEPIARKEIVKAINKMGLQTYKLNYRPSNDYLKSWLRLSRFFTRKMIWWEAVQSALAEIAAFIRRYIENLKNSGEYEKLNREVKIFKLKETVLDSAGNIINQAVKSNLFITTDTDIDRQFMNAEAILKNEGIALNYVNTFADTNGIIDCKIDVILFAQNTDCLQNLEKFAQNKFHELIDTYRKETAKLTGSAKTEYDQIVFDADKVSKTNFYLPESINFTQDADGKVYERHLFIDKKTGTAKIKLNGWEEKILEEEMQREDFVCWIRNAAGKSYSLCIVYEDERHEEKLFYPDFLIVRRIEGNYIVDILEPHDPNRRDNIGKARGLAEYAKRNPIIGRLELIREQNISGQKFFKRLDISKSSIREQVRRASTNSELDNIFDRA